MSTTSDREFDTPGAPWDDQELLEEQDAIDRMNAVVEERARGRVHGARPPRRDRDRQLRLAVAGLARPSSSAPTRCSTSSRTSSRAAGDDVAPEAVIDALGDSIDAEELKGDYAAAAAAAAAGALDAARAGGDPPARADAAIWAGIVAALRSEPAAAAAQLEEALAAVPDHPLGAALRHFATGAEPQAAGRSRPRRRSCPTPGPSRSRGDPLEAELKVLTLLPASAHHAPVLRRGAPPSLAR